MDDRLIIANCSGFFGDRLSAAAEMVRGGPIDVLTGDYLAELTMAILFRKQLKDPMGGYAGTFLRQMEEIMAECLDKNIRVVTNAGGLSPKGMALELEKIASELGLKPVIAYIEGDNLLTRLTELQDDGEPFIHIDKGIPLKDANAMTVTANAYLGGWGITEALNMGADIVVCGRVTDASLVTGPSAWKFGWKKDDWDKLAGAVAAGHIIECGTQATGGNYSFFKEVPSFKNVGFPIAEIYPDGSSIITKHPGTGGIVSVGTVTAQLMYEVQAPRYLNPDVIARFDTINLSQEGPDRVKVEGTRGEPPASTTKVCINNLGGYRNMMTIVLTGMDIKEKAQIVEDSLLDMLGGRDAFQVIDFSLIDPHIENPVTNEEAFAFLRVSIMDPDQKRAGKLFSSKIVELALSNVPGFTLTSPPSNAMPAIVHWPALMRLDRLKQTISVNGEEIILAADSSSSQSIEIIPLSIELPDVPLDNMKEAPFGTIFGTRSGDKGGNANLGVWAKNKEAYAFLCDFLTTDKLKELLPDTAEFDIDRYEFKNLLALNFYIKGILGDGVAASLRSDPQAKTLGEYLRGKVVSIPASLLG